MNFNQIKTLAEKYLAVLTGVGTAAVTAAVMSVIMGINNKVNNGGFFKFKNQNTAIVNALNGEINKIVKEKENKANEELTKIDNKYKQEAFVGSNQFEDNVEGITSSSGNQLTADFVAKIVANDKENPIFKGGSFNGAKKYSDMIGSGKPYKDLPTFMTAVNKVRDKEKEAIQAEEVKLSEVELDGGAFELKNNKIVLKQQQQ